MGNVIFQLFIITAIALGSIYILYTLMFNKNVIGSSNHKKQRNYIKEFYNMILEDYNINMVIENIVVNSEEYFSNKELKEEKDIVESLKKECFNKSEHTKVDDEEIRYLIKIAGIFYKA